MKSITVKIDDKDIVINKLPILRYAEMLKAIKELPKHLGGLDLQNVSVMELIKQLPFLAGVSIPDLIDILVIATDIDKATLEKLGLSEIIDITEAVAVVNDYQNVFDKLKKVMAQPRVKKSLKMS